MRLRSFTAPTMKEAMNLVRAELGDDAIILNSEKIGRAVKVTAALDHSAILRKPSEAADAKPIDLIAASLDFHGVPRRLCDRLTDMAGNFLLENPRQALAGALRSHFSHQPIMDRRPVRPILLVGLPGAGKTSGLAKLVARARLRNWPAAVVTCDLDKAGGVEQLDAYAKALNVSSFRARDEQSLKRVVTQIPAEAFVIVDSVGCNPLIPADLDRLTGLGQAINAELVLVMAAGGDAAESAELGQLFAESGVKRMVATRIDTARRYGGLLAAADAGKMALAEFSVSAEIARGLVSSGADLVANLILPANGAEAVETRVKAKTAGLRI
jgi:flagellar biosynthesis protein FlhF